MTTIQLTLPIQIRPTINKDGYVIIDANESEFFFYREKEGSNKMIYDGCAINVKNENEKK